MNKPSPTARCLAVLEALASSAQRGASNAELTSTCGLSAVQTTRACADLLACGWARKNEENGRYYPTPAFARLAYQIDRDFGRARQELDDRYNALRGGL